MLVRRFTDHIKQANLFGWSERLLLAVSGGVDSVVLCELCARAGLSFGIAHANFRLRGDESDGDEELVRSLAAEYRVPVHVRVFDTTGYMASRKVSVQVAARELRYQWFNELLDGGFDRLLTAHHADDAVETMLMHFFRGTGITGLKGIPEKSSRIVRPLLTFKKQEILDFAQAQSLRWRSDSSNASEKYSRNFFRNTVLPLVREVYAEAEAGLFQNLTRFQEAAQLYEQAIAKHKKTLLEFRGEEVHVPVLKLRKLTPLRTILFEIIRDYGFSAAQVDDAIHLLDADTGKSIASPSHRLIRNRAWLIIAPSAGKTTSIMIINAEDNVAAGGRLTLSRRKPGAKEYADDPAKAVIDAREIIYPLILRPWKKGDYFYPLGMRKKKKISRFLIDQKLSPTEKEKVQVLETDKRICWVVGMRIDDRFKVTDSTREVLQISTNNY